MYITFIRKKIAVLVFPFVSGNTVFITCLKFCNKKRGGYFNGEDNQSHVLHKVFVILMVY